MQRQGEGREKGTSEENEKYCYFKSSEVFLVLLLVTVISPVPRIVPVT